MFFFPFVRFLGIHQPYRRGLSVTSFICSPIILISLCSAVAAANSVPAAAAVDFGVTVEDGDRVTAAVGVTVDVAAAVVVG